MTNIIELFEKHEINFDKVFFRENQRQIALRELLALDTNHLSEIQPGEVVALIGDFDSQSLADLIRLIEIEAVIVPLTIQTRTQHDYFFETTHTKWVVENGAIRKLHNSGSHPFLDEIKKRKTAGLILFSTGTTGKPKAILHDFSLFLNRFLTPRPAMITLNFLLFDHIGGLNTFFHAVFNSGLIISIKDRSVGNVLEICRKNNVEVLPTTPTFLRMLLMSGELENNFPQSIKIITYGTERMDQHTLDELNRKLPTVEFRQTYGMSELGILRIKSESNTSLYMQVGGEGVETKIEEGILKIRSSTRMIGYLNADSPFDSDGWYDTKDLVEAKGNLIKIIGRSLDAVNVGGLKFLLSEVEDVILANDDIENVFLEAKSNPITGQHVEAIISPQNPDSFDLEKFKNYLKSELPAHMVPRRINLGNIKVNHRFKKGS